MNSKDSIDQDIYSAIQELPSGIYIFYNTKFITFNKLFDFCVFNSLFFYKIFLYLTKEGSNKWIFCACNEPARLFLSVSNSIFIKYYSMEKSQSVINSFTISYRFIPSTHTKAGQLRIVQNHQLSYVEGYYLRVKVPHNNHLRLYGKSAKCHFPKYSLINLKVIGEEITEKLVKEDQIAKPVQFIVKQDEFRKSCSYLFDIKEPNIKWNSHHQEKASKWQMDWFIKFENSTIFYDFEINWKFFKNEIQNEKHNSFLLLPRQIGFEVNFFIQEYLEFYFKSSSNTRKYSLNFDTDTPKGSYSLFFLYFAYMRN